MNPTLWVILSVHAVVDLALLLGPWQLLSGTPAIVRAWPISQNSLVAIWAASSRGPTALRFAGCLLAVAWTWLLLIVLLPDMAVHDKESAGWAVACATHSAVIVLVAATARLAWRRSGEGPMASGTVRGRFQFGVGFLLLWTAAIALLLGLCRTAVTQLGWTEESFHWLYFLYMPVIGSGNAAVALVVLLSLLGRRWLVARLAGALVFVSMVGYAQPCLLKWLFKSSGALTPGDTVVVALAQAVYLYATLIPLRAGEHCP